MTGTIVAPLFAASARAASGTPGRWPKISIWHGALVDQLRRALVASPPLDAAQGGYIAEGYDAALDDLRATGGSGRRDIATLEAQYRDRTGIAALKIRLGRDSPRDDKAVAIRTCRTPERQ